MAQSSKQSLVEGDEKAKHRRPVPLYPGFPELTRSDVSIHPTYSKLKLDYRVVCRHRYHFAKMAQRRRFLQELEVFERLQPIALDGVRVHREFSQGILSHRIPEDKTHLTPDPLTRHERSRLENIINGVIRFD